MSVHHRYSRSSRVNGVDSKAGSLRLEASPGQRHHLPRERGITGTGSRVAPPWLRRAGGVHMAAVAQPTDVLILDFDGVLVNSEPEVGTVSLVPDVVPMLPWYFYKLTK